MAPDHRSHHLLAPVVALVIIATAACNGESAPDVTAPPPGTRPPRTAPEPDTTTTSNASSTATSTGTTIPGATTPGATSAQSSSTSASTTAPPPPIATAPPVATLIPQVPTPLDPNDPNNQRPVPSPEEQAIINAYIIGTDALTRRVSVFPRDPNDPLLTDGPFTAKFIEDVRQGEAQIADLRVVLDAGGGATYRPYVLGYEPGATEVFVADCQLDATVWRDVDTGAVVEPPLEGFPNTGPDEAAAIGIGAVLVLEDGRWLIDQNYTDGSACVPF